MGYRIASEELHGEKRAEYGAKIIKKLSKELSTEYGKGLQKQIYTIFIHFIKLIQRFSTQRVEKSPTDIIMDTLSHFITSKR